VVARASSRAISGGALPFSRGPPAPGGEEQIDPSNVFDMPHACSVPRERGVRGAARGLERELKAPRRHRKKKIVVLGEMHNSKQL